MAGLYDNLVANATTNGHVKLAIWQLIVTIRQYIENTITLPTVVARFPGLSATAVSELQSLANWSKTTAGNNGKNKIPVFDELWHTLAACEFGYMTEAEFKARFGIV